MHDRGAADGTVERFVRDAVGTGFRVTAGPVWLMVMPGETALPEHGWKLHISARVAEFADLVKTVLPVLTRARCAFKLARSYRVLAELNDGLSSPASVGKAVTVYPGQEQVVGLGLELARLLEGWSGPKVLSDRQVARSAPVYYRYGPFTTRWEPDSIGRLVSMVQGPGGEVFEAAARLGYRQPTWVRDPFTGEGAEGDTPGPAILGGCYQITAGLRRAARGNIYRAVDQRNGCGVVIKQARALVAEDPGGADTRLRLRNERRVLQALDGIAGVSRFVDHFRYGADEFLVTSDCGSVTLAEDVLRHGPYPLSAQARGLGGLAVSLARIVSDIHACGVIVRDLSPANIVIGDAGPSVVDFGISGYDGLHLQGATPGFASTRQWRGEPPARMDDYYALGMTLLFAGTGLDPVTAGDDPEEPRIKALQTIGSLFGPEPAGVIAVIADLLSAEEPITRAAFGRLLSAGPAGRRAAAPLPVIGPVTAELSAEVTGTLAAELMRCAGEVLDSPHGQAAAHDASIYRGSAGIGLELLRHLDMPGAAAMVADLSTFSAAAVQQVTLPPGLFTGTTGVSIFLHQVAAAGIAIPVWPSNLPGPAWQPADRDLISGAAGVGLGHLWLHDATGDPAHLAVAVRCGEHIMAGDSTHSPPAPRTQTLPGVDPATGRAHGLAGVTGFLVTLAARTGDQSVLAAAAGYAARLAARTRQLLPEVSHGSAAIATSWCQGLAGIGQVLLQVSHVLGDATFDNLARQTADVCIASLPRISAPARCCGAAGTGHLLIDLALAEGDNRYWQAAYDVARHMLLRAGGPPGQPIFVPDNPDHSASTWAFGTAGLLSFFRRLARPGDADSIPLPSL